LILLIEPTSKNIDMYVPAYPLPIMEIASFVKSNSPETELEVISIPMDYGLPLSPEGRDHVYDELMKDLSGMKVKGIGISCTAIAQAEETVHLCERIKETDPDIFIFLGGYFPTLYYQEIFLRTSAVDLIVVGEGEVPALKIIKKLEKGEDPRDKNISNLAWKKDGRIHQTEKGPRFDLNKKALLNLGLLRHPGAYDVLPYSFSRGCPYRCNFCMEDYIRPTRKAVPRKIIEDDLKNLSQQSNARILMVSDALFRSFDLFPLFRSLGINVNFETRCDVLNPLLIPNIKDVCSALALGFESASYGTLRRMNKVKDRAHYHKYLSNTVAIFEEAVKYEIPIMVFMIAGYPGDTEEDLAESLAFAKELSKNSGTGGHVFKIGECRVYPKTKLYDFAKSSPDTIFDDDGVFGQNIVRQPSKSVDFATILAYMNEIFNLSNTTEKLTSTLVDIMPFFRLPSHAFDDNIIPERCFRGKKSSGVLDVRSESLSMFKKLLPDFIDKYSGLMSGQRSTRNLAF
jgi:hypothetical protein